MYSTYTYTRYLDRYHVSQGEALIQLLHAQIYPQLHFLDHFSSPIGTH